MGFCGIRSAENAILRRNQQMEILKLNKLIIMAIFVYFAVCAT